MQHGRRVKRAGRRHAQQLIVRDAAPQEERQPRRELEVADAIDRAGRNVRRIALDAERELRAGQNPLQRRLHARVECALLAAKHVEVVQPFEIARCNLAAIGTARKRRDDAACACILFACRRGTAREDAAAAWRRARPGRVVRPGQGERVEMRMADRIERVIRAADERLQPKRVDRVAALDERRRDDVWAGLQRNADVGALLDVVARLRHVLQVGLEIFFAAYP